MKYSIGITNNRSKRQRKKKYSPKKSFIKGYTPTSLSKYRTFKDYNRKNTSGRKKTPINTRNKGKGKKELSLRTRKLLYVGAGTLFFLGCIALIGVGIYLKNLQNSLPSPDELIDRASEQSTQILDRDGELLYTIYGDKNREFVPIDKIPEHTKWAVLAAEDIEFHQHKGMNFFSIFKAFIQNMLAKKVVRGASTVTQQLVKTTILYDVLGDEAFSQNYSRKIKEALITMQVERTFTKDEILQMYMNEVPLGGVNYGFQAAANAYFDKDVEDLTLAESALLAGLIQSPGITSPLFGSNPESAVTRQEYVLKQMYKNRKLTGITKDEMEEAKEEKIVYNTREIDIEAPHFVFYVKQLLEEEFGEERVERGGLKVTTTLDHSLQKIAEEEIVKGVEGAAKNNVHNGAMVVINPKNGQVLAMVGSVDYFNIEDPRVDGNVNVTLRGRQMGSSVKPFVYLSAFNQGYGPWLLTPDIKEISFGNYKPQNWDGGYFGLITARKALVQSRNIPAVYTLQVGGIDNFLQTMERLGITGLSDKASYGLSLGLGSGEMKLLEFTNAYATLANSGVANDVVSILKVEDSKGKVLMEAEEDKGRRVIDEKEAYLINWVTCDLGGFNDKYGNQYYYIGNSKMCGKTGTTDGPRDLLAFMYNQNIVVGIWTGNNNNEEMPGGWSSTIPLPMANSFMKRVIENYPTETYNRPAGISTTAVCTDTGASAQEDTDCTKEQSLYISGRPPQVDKRKTIEVCSKTGLIPENLDVAKKYGLTKKVVLLSTTLENSLQEEAYRTYLLSLEDSKYIFSEPEKAICPLPLGPNNAPVIEITKPSSKVSVQRGSNLEISGHVRFLEKLKEFKIQFAGSDIPGVSVKNDGSFLLNYSIPSTATLGEQTITIIATDNYNKKDSKSVKVNVQGQSSPVSIRLLAPANGVNISFPVLLKASALGESIDKVLFSVSKVGGGYNKEYLASKSAEEWIYEWNFEEGIAQGKYKITPIGKSSSTSITGDSVTVSYD